MAEAEHGKLGRRGQKSGLRIKTIQRSLPRPIGGVPLAVLFKTPVDKLRVVHDPSAGAKLENGFLHIGGHAPGDVVELRVDLEFGKHAVACEKKVCHRPAGVNAAQVAQIFKEPDWVLVV